MHLLLIPFLFLFAQSNISYNVGSHDFGNHDDWDVNVRNPKEFHASDGCSQFEIQPAYGTLARGEETFAVPASQGLDLAFGHYGGVYVEGTSTVNFKVTVCKAAGGNSQSEASGALKSIRVNRN